MSRDQGRSDPRRRTPPLGKGELDRLIFGPQPAPEEGEDDMFEPRNEPLFPEREPPKPAAAGRRPSPDYVPLPDDPVAYRPPPRPQRPPVFMIAAVVALGVLGYLLWSTYRDGVRSETAIALPQLPGGTFKSRPDPVPGAPELPDASVLEETVAAAPTPDTAEASAAAVGEERPAGAGASAAAPPAPARAAPPPAPAEPQRVQRPPIAQPPSPSPAPAGAFLVQLAAPSTEAAARAEWERLRRLDPPMFAGRDPVIVRAEVGGRTVYRLRVAGFPGAAEADAFCARLKGLGADCFRAAP